MCFDRKFLNIVAKSVRDIVFSGRLCLETLSLSVVDDKQEGVRVTIDVVATEGDVNGHNW